MDEPNKREIKPVVQINQEQVKKNSTGRQFLSSLMIDDFGIVKDYLLFDILGPAIQNTIIDGLCGAITTIFGGNAASKNYRPGSSYRRDTNSRTSYSNVTRVDTSSYLRPSQERRSYDEPIWNRRSSMDYMDIPFSSRPEAERVLEAMREIIERDQYPAVSVADFYDLVGYNYGNNYTCHDYGWPRDVISNVSITWSRGAWYIALPRAVPIK